MKHLGLESFQDIRVMFEMTCASTISGSKTHFELGTVFKYKTICHIVKG